jgi:hypothetical protein
LLSSFVRLDYGRRLRLAPDSGAPQQLLDQRLHLRKLDRRQIG